jgi:CheY-like chemotaxis protein
VLEVARIANHEITLEMQPVDLATIVAAAVERTRPAAEAKGVRLEIEPRAGVTRVLGDAPRLQQIIANLIENAIKLTPADGRITLRTGRDHGQARLVVTDTGSGIPPAVLPYVFDGFRQTETSGQRKHGGLGLGLAIVRNLVEAHGGTVIAESPGEGHGTTITVELPLESAGMSRPDTDTVARFPSVGAAAPDPSSPILAGVRVVIADDDPDALELMKTILEEYGADVATAGSAGEVLDVLQQGRPDVLISDIGMPDADGYALLRKVRAPDTGERGMVPAIAVTGYVSAGDRHRALAAGYQLHLAKPFDAAELITAVARLAGRT